MKIKIEKIKEILRDVNNDIPKITENNKYIAMFGNYPVPPKVKARGQASKVFG